MLNSDLLNRTLTKRAELNIYKTRSLPGYLPGTIGRLQGLPLALMVGQEKAPSFMEDADEELYRKFYAKYKKDKELADVQVNVGGISPIGQIGRVWGNRRSDVLSKLLGTVVSPLSAFDSLLSRSPQYDPFANSVVTYGNLTPILQHELGHAKDFNNKGMLARALYGIARPVESAISRRVLGVSLPGPLTQWQESMANVSALEKIDEAKERREYRRRAWPARSTYITALALGLAGLVKPEVASWVTAQDKSTPKEQMLFGLLRGLGVVGGGALLGRGAAELRNLSDVDAKEKAEKKRRTHDADLAGAVPA